ncbi:MAG: peptidylprolyl isomerase [Ruminococcaceae bacterium]|nr:peptidylprolyl isomerase [Oscillospiraceae bacterium]
MTKKIIAILIVTISVFCLFSCSKSNGLEHESYTIEIEIEDYGTITAVLDAKTAPITVKNFITLAEDGFYNGIVFHRIIEGFMMQGGDPDGDGLSNNGTATIKGEFSANGVKNEISHLRGTLSMARLGNDYDSASTQFFIMHQDDVRLDGEYAAFGRVTKGIEIVDKICEEAVVTDSNGTVHKDYRPVIKEIRVLTPESEESK